MRGGEAMRAVVYDSYGPPDVLRLEEVEQPVPEADEVLVKIHAATVNRTDCGWRSAKPFFTRAFIGLLRPRRKILGTELAGEVEAVGAAVSEFEVGDEVFGVKGFGAHAEFITLRESAPLSLKPAGMSFEEAAAVCDGACTALSCLRGAEVRKGRSILIYGASGSIGTATVQLARYFDADALRRLRDVRRSQCALAQSPRRWYGFRLLITKRPCLHRHLPPICDERVDLARPPKPVIALVSG
jgi:NADPH:quinone reductase-like Zn-dependent oxidoreductase